jgi:hypothetical protein
MKRNEFLKKLAIGAGTLTIIPTLLVAKNTGIQNLNTKLAIDVNSLTNMTWHGKKLNPSDIMELYRQTGILVYRSGGGIIPPMVIEGEVEVVDATKLHTKNKKF